MQPTPPPTPDPPPTPESDPIAISVVVIAVGVAFVWIAVSRDTAGGLLDVTLLTAILIASALSAHRARGPRPMRVIGTCFVLAAGWLLFQRRDLTTAAILAGFFGAGLGLATRGHDRPRERGWPRPTVTLLLIGLAAFTMYVGAETPSVHWFGGGITQGRSLYGEVALTFDDGPNPTATRPIMEILDAAKVKGTFFEVGRAIDAYPQITRTLHEHGHLLGNHSYNHDDWRWLDPRYPELERAQRAFQRVIGVCPAFYRPPHGERSPLLARVVNDNNMRMVMWNVSASDWSSRDAQKIARRIVNRARGGSIIRLHDGLEGDAAVDRDVLVKALPLILDGLRKKDLEVVRLDKLIGGPAYISC